MKAVIHVVSLLSAPSLPLFEGGLGHLHGVLVAAAYGGSVGSRRSVRLGPGASHPWGAAGGTP